MEYLIVKWLHVVSSTLLFGTDLGSAFYLFFTNRSGDVRAIAIVCRRVYGRIGCSRHRRRSFSPPQGSISCTLPVCRSHFNG